MRRILFYAVATLSRGALCSFATIAAVFIIAAVSITFAALCFVLCPFAVSLSACLYRRLFTGYFSALPYLLPSNVCNVHSKQFLEPF